MIGKMSPESDEKLKKILHTESKSFYPEVQERANEYITFTQIAKNDLQRKITTNIPVPKFDNEENETSNTVGEEPPIEHKDTIVEEYETDKGYRNLINGASVTGDSSGIGSGKPKKAKKKKEENVQIQPQNVQPPQQKPSEGGIDLFGDFFGGPSTNTNVNTNANNTGANNNNSNDIFNLFGNMGSNTNQNQGTGMLDLGSMMGNNNQQQKSDGVNLDFTGGKPQQNNAPKNLKEVYKNEDIAIYSNLIPNNNVYNGSFYVSNNTSSQISEFNLNFMVKKYISSQILSTSGKDLAPKASLGIKKDVTMVNNDPSKDIVIKMVISYIKDGNEKKFSEKITLDS
jgi:hypothetical protein